MLVKFFTTNSVPILEKDLDNVTICRWSAAVVESFPNATDVILSLEGRNYRISYVKWNLASTGSYVKVVVS
jgi:hypothetical protein